MKKRKLKEIIKAAFIAEITDADEFFYSPVMEEDLDEMIANLDEADDEEPIEDIIARITGTPLAEAKGDETEEILDTLETLRAQAKEDRNEKFLTLLNNAIALVNKYMIMKVKDGKTLNLDALKAAIEKGDFDAFTKFQRNPYLSTDPYMAEGLAEAEGDEEEDVEVDAEEETTDGGEEKNDSIVVDKKIVSLSSLPGETRKILDTLETLRAQAEEFGDQKFITQVGNTITFFTRDFVVAGDEPTRAKVDESLEILRMKKLAGLLTEGEYAKALLRENQTNFPSEDEIKRKGAVGDSVTVSKDGKNYDINYTISSESDDEMSFGIYDSEEGEDAEQIEEFYTYKELINWFNN